MSSITKLKGVKRTRGKHNKKSRKGGSRPQLHPDEPFIKPLKKSTEEHKTSHRTKDRASG